MMEVIMYLAEVVPIKNREPQQMSVRGNNLVLLLKICA